MLSEDFVPYHIFNSIKVYIFALKSPYPSLAKIYYVGRSKLKEERRIKEHFRANKEIAARIEELHWFKVAEGLTKKQSAVLESIILLILCITYY